MELTRYWFEFDLTLDEPHPIGVLIGCGVTAHNYEDAIMLLRQRVFTHDPLPTITRVVADVDISTLDADHVLPNMGIPSERGIWYPIGY